MPEEFLHGADVVAGFQQMGGETVAQRMATRELDDPGQAHGILDRPLQSLLVEMQGIMLEAHHFTDLVQQLEFGIRDKPFPRF